MFVDANGFLEFDGSGLAPRHASLDCSIRTGEIPFLIMPSTNEDLRENPLPYRKITYSPLAPHGRCGDVQKRVSAPVASNDALYSVIRKSSTALTGDDIRLGIKGDVLKISDIASGKLLAQVSYYYIHDEYKVCPSRDGALHIRPIVYGALGLR